MEFIKRLRRGSRPVETDGQAAQTLLQRSIDRDQAFDPPIAGRFRDGRPQPIRGFGSLLPGTTARRVINGSLCNSAEAVPAGGRRLRSTYSRTSHRRNRAHRSAGDVGARRAIRASCSLRASAPPSGLEKEPHASPKFKGCPQTCPGGTATSAVAARITTESGARRRVGRCRRGRTAPPPPPAVEVEQRRLAKRQRVHSRAADGPQQASGRRSPLLSARRSGARGASPDSEPRDRQAASRGGRIGSTATAMASRSIGSGYASAGSVSARRRRLV